MKTQYIGRLVNNITVEGFVSKSPQYADHEILFHDERDVLHSYKGGIIKQISYDVALLNSIVFTSTEPITEYYTTGTPHVVIDQDIARVEIDSTTGCIYIPILKYVKSITHVDPTTKELRTITNELFESENIVTLNINNSNIPYREVIIKKSPIAKIQIHIHLIDIAHHYNDYQNPHNVSKFQMGLSNVDNTADIDKPVSKATNLFIDGLFKKLNGNLEGYFRNHNNTIKENTDELKNAFDKVVKDFENVVVKDAKEQLDSIKALGNVQTLIDDKFKTFNDESKKIQDVAKGEIGTLIEKAKELIALMDKKESDFKESIDSLTTSVDKKVGAFGRQINAIETKLSEHATAIRNLSNKSNG